MPLRGVGPTGRRLDLEQKSSFMDGHYLKFAVTFFERDKFAINTMRYPDIIVNIHTPATGKIKYATGKKLYFCALNFDDFHKTVLYNFTLMEGLKRE